MPCSFGRCLFAALLSVVATGCLGDAERSNPLDPLSDGFRNEGSLTGQVVDQASRPIAGALVHLETMAGERVSSQATDGAGSYAFAVVSADSYRLQVEKEGFVGRTDSLEILAGRVIEFPQVRLNALPIVRESRAITHHVSRWWPEHDLFVLELIVLAEDPDDRPGVEGVWLVLSTEDMELRLSQRPLPGEFGGVISTESLPERSVHSLMGVPFAVRIRDRDGHEVLRAIPSPARVIDYTPIPIAPDGLALLDEPRPQLEWSRTLLPYAHTFRVHVLRDEVNTDVLIQEYSDIPKDSTTLRLQSPLGTGSYYWTIAVVDAFGNTSRSKEAGFRIN